MKPVTFPQANRTWGERQPEYLPLPTWTDGTETISLWRFTWRERLAVLLGADVWVRLCNFGHPLQPQALQLTEPFEPQPARGYTPTVATHWPAAVALMRALFSQGGRVDNLVGEDLGPEDAEDYLGRRQ